MLPPRRVVAIGALVVLAALVAGATATGLVSWSSLGKPLARSHLTGAPRQRSAHGEGTEKRRVRPRARDVSLVGTDSWRLTRPAHDEQIAGYALQMSVLPGQPVVLRVSTPAARFRVRAYRFGAYRGGRAHLVWRSRWVAGGRQASASFADRSTRTVVARWHDSTTVPTDGWPAGAYLLELVSSSGWQSYVPVFVRSASTAGSVVLVAPVATWQAYNAWGGYSLYVGAPGDRRSWKVSYDRPFAGLGRSVGAADMLYGVSPVVVQAERAGVPLAYETDLDVDADPHLLDGARAYVSMGHDEYWTESMRRAVLAARDAGTNLMFLGADTEFWRIRLAPSPTGPRRLQVGYRWAYQADPLWPRRPTRATSPFGIPPASEAENALSGMRYECYPVEAPYTVTDPHWWGFRGTGVRRGQRFPRLVGIEADRVYPDGSTPRPLQILSDTSYSCLGVGTSAQSVYYTTPSGAGVFNVGTLRWTCSLERLSCGAYPISAATQRFTRRVTQTVLRAFARGPVATTYPAHDNVAHYALPTTHDVPAE